MFTKADFKNGEMAALIQIGEAARRCSGSYIIEAPVTKIGRKYITVSLSWGNIQFEYYENDNRIKKANIARIMNSTQPEL